MVKATDSSLDRDDCWTFPGYRRWHVSREERGTGEALTGSLSGKDRWYRAGWLKSNPCKRASLRSQLVTIKTIATVSPVAAASGQLSVCIAASPVKDDIGLPSGRLGEIWLRPFLDGEALTAASAESVVALWRRHSSSYGVFRLRSPLRRR